MANILISLDELQIQRIEQIVMDQDGNGAVKFLEELRKHIKIKKIGCNPMEFRARQDIEEVIDDAKKEK